jgi:hypothetical protein
VCEKGALFFSVDDFFLIGMSDWWCECLVHSTESEQNGAIPVPSKPNPIEGGDRVTKVAKGKAVAQETLKNPPSSSSNQRPDAIPLDGIELLQGKKVSLFLCFW